MNWTATARRADIVLPVAAPQERLDFGAGKSDNALIPMHALVPPAGQSRVEHEFFADLAARMGVEADFTEGRDTQGWVRHLWEVNRKRGSVAGVILPE